MWPLGGEQQDFAFAQSQGFACDDNLPSSFNALDYNKASQGEVCSLKPCPSSNAKTVTLPLSRFRITRLTTDPS
jgi:hypothetical protein